MKILFKIFGVLIILVIGLGFLFYGKSNSYFAKAEKAYRHGDFETAKLFYEKGIEGLEKLHFSKIPLLDKKSEKIREKLEDVSKLARAWTVYCQGYYDSEKYRLAEEIVNQELRKEESADRDQFHNLKALICWQKGVDLFIELGKKAANSKELNQLLEEAKMSSGEAVESNDGDDVDIKYNYEFFRKPKEELKKNMQQAAKQKKTDRDMKKKAEQTAEEKEIKPNNQQDQQQEQMTGEEKKEDKKKGEQMEELVPMEKKQREKATEPTEGTDKKKKKKKG